MNVLLQITSAAESGQRVSDDGTVKSAFDDGQGKKTNPGDNPVKVMSASEMVSLVNTLTHLSSTTDALLLWLTLISTSHHHQS